MPLASNSVLLQPTPTVKVSSSVLGATNPAAKVSEPGKSDASSFANLYAKHTQDTQKADSSPAKGTDTPQKTSHDKVANTATKAQSDHDKISDKKPAVADNGKALPAKGSVKSAKNSSDQDDDDDDRDDKTTQASDAATTSTAPADQPLDPMVMLAMTGQMPDTTTAAPPAPLALPQPPVQVPAAATAADPAADPNSAATSSLPPISATDKTSPADALADALGTTTTPAVGEQTQVGAAHTAKPGEQAQNTPGQDFANLLAGNGALGQQASGDSTDGKGGDADKSLIGAVEGTSTDKTSATGSADAFTDKLNALGQAVATRATGAAATGQPLAMHQSGWTEAVVDRVMYLSAQNLKSAEIQLAPPELGRLDVRVDMKPDQTQVTFTSAHAGVREALDSNLPKLREMFAQQGLAQPDVNVSDQSRGWQQNQQNQQAQSGGGSRGGRGGSADDGDDGTSLSVAATSSAAATVIGTSAVDYYA